MKEIITIQRNKILKTIEEFEGDPDLDGDYEWYLEQIRRECVALKVLVGK